MSSGTSDTSSGTSDTGVTGTPTTGIDPCQAPPEPPTGAYTVRREPNLVNMSVFMACPELAELGFFPGGTNISIQLWRPHEKPGDNLGRDGARRHNNSTLTVNLVSALTLGTGRNSSNS